MSDLADTIRVRRALQDDAKEILECLTLGVQVHKEVRALCDDLIAATPQEKPQGPHDHTFTYCSLCVEHGMALAAIQNVPMKPQEQPRRFTEVTKELYELQQKYSTLVDEYSEAKSQRIFDQTERDALEWAESVDRLAAGNTHALAFARMLAHARRIKQRGRMLAESAPESEDAK